MAMKVLAYIIIGLIHQFFASLIPFREQKNARDYLWDTAGIVLTIVAFGLYGLAFGGPIVQWLSQFPAIAEWHATVRTYPWLMMVAVNFVVADFINYWAHRLLHTRAFWHTHAWHHAPKHLWWMSGLRGSPVHVFINLLPYTITYLIFPTTAGGLLGMALAVLGIANQHWQHSNISLPKTRLIELLVVTPRVHFVHHSADPKFTNSNYGFITTIWDRMFGTYVDPDTVPIDEPLGLDYEITNARLMIGLPPEVSAKDQHAALRELQEDPRISISDKEMASH